MQGIADYTFVRALGQGNNGEYFLAVPPPRLGLDVEHVEVKVSPVGSNADGLRRVTRELRAFAAVSSQYVATIYDAGQEGDAFFYAMEHFPMGSLGTERRTWPVTVAAVADAARAAHALHEGGIVHRDISPWTVKVIEGGGRLSDLGLAQLVAPGATLTGMGAIGSVEFMDPGLLRGGQASRATDVWSLVATLHWSLAGRGMYGDLPTDEPLVAIRRILRDAPVIDASIEGAARDVIGRCLAPDPADRPSTAAEVAGALDALEP